MGGRRSAPLGRRPCEPRLPARAFTRARRARHYEAELVGLLRHRSGSPAARTRHRHPRTRRYHHPQLRALDGLRRSRARLQRGRPARCHLLAQPRGAGGEPGGHGGRGHPAPPHRRLRRQRASARPRHRGRGGPGRGPGAGGRGGGGRCGGQDKRGRRKPRRAPAPYPGAGVRRDRLHRLDQQVPSALHAARWAPLHLPGRFPQGARALRGRLEDLEEHRCARPRRRVHRAPSARWLGAAGARVPLPAEQLVRIAARRPHRRRRNAGRGRRPRAFRGDRLPPARRHRPGGAPAAPTRLLVHRSYRGERAGGLRPGGAGRPAAPRQRRAHRALHRGRSGLRAFLDTNKLPIGTRCQLILELLALYHSRNPHVLLSR